MSYMSELATAGITVGEMSAYLAEHPGVDFDEAVKIIQNRHTRDGKERMGNADRRNSKRPADAPVWTIEQRLRLDTERNGPRTPNSVGGA